MSQKSIRRLIVASRTIIWNEPCRVELPPICHPCRVQGAMQPFGFRVHFQVACVAFVISVITCYMLCSQASVLNARPRSLALPKDTEVALEDAQIGGVTGFLLKLGGFYSKESSFIRGVFLRVAIVYSEQLLCSVLQSFVPRPGFWMKYD